MRILLTIISSLAVVRATVTQCTEEDLLTLAGSFYTLKSSIESCTAKASQVESLMCLANVVSSVNNSCTKCLVSTLSTDAGTCVFGCISNPSSACGQCGLNFVSAALTTCIPSDLQQPLMELLQGQMTEVMNQLLRSVVPNTACYPVDIDLSQVQTLPSDIVTCVGNPLGVAECLAGLSGYNISSNCIACVGRHVEAVGSCSNDLSCITNAVSIGLAECTGISNYVVDGLLLNETTGAPTTAGVVTTSPSSASALSMSIVMLMITLIHL